MSIGESPYDRVNDYGAVKIGLASPYDIRSWSFGEVKKPETINYRTYRPEVHGLFCERIFGPEKDWECACGKYRGMKYKGIICDRCGVKVTHSRVRRKRMGHIELAAPVVHIWFLKERARPLATLLGMKTTTLERIIYFHDYVVVDPGDTLLKEGQPLNEEDFRKAREQFGDTFHADMGADSIRKLLARLDLASLSKQLRQELTETSSKRKKGDLTRRLKVVESLRDSDNRPEWMVLEVMPVIPPDLRPLVLLDSGNFATSDLNDLYKRIINRNNRLKKLVDLNAPEDIIRGEKRILQQAVDALFDNNRCKRPVLGSSNRPLNSLTDLIKGKQGRFRKDLLGKRVDYSARSAIVVDPDLRLHQCGLPKKIAWELFRPFIIRRLIELGHADTDKSAKKMLKRKDKVACNLLEEVTKNHPILLNRTPTLHRNGIQAFEPVLVEGNAIRIHPLVCKEFNADFDGDQMVVHLPLSIEAQIEASTLMISSHHLFSPANGQPSIGLRSEILLGLNHLTAFPPPGPGLNPAFASPQEVHLAMGLGKIEIHSRIRLRLPIAFGSNSDPQPGHSSGQVIETTVGLVMFNDCLPQDLPYYNITITYSAIWKILDDCHRLCGRAAMVNLIDDLKSLGFQSLTRSGLSIGLEDFRVPHSKNAILSEADGVVHQTWKSYRDGETSEQTRRLMTLDAWSVARERMASAMNQIVNTNTHDSNLFSRMVELGLCDQDKYVRTTGMVGLVARPSGRISEVPIRSSLGEGLSIHEYFLNSHSAIQRVIDRKSKTSDLGYLTRKLADVAQNVVVTEEDCRTSRGVAKDVCEHPGKTRGLRGRTSTSDIRDQGASKILLEAGGLITEEMARKIAESGLRSVIVRSPLTCEAAIGICRKCYGEDLSNGKLVELGTAVGIIAAQSIGEPGTQSMMDLSPIGDVAWELIRSGYAGRVGYKDLIPGENFRVEQSFAGRIRRVVQHEAATGAHLFVEDADGHVLSSHRLPCGTLIEVDQGDVVVAGDVLARVPVAVGGHRNSRGRLLPAIRMLEAREPTQVAVLAETDGRIEIRMGRDGRPTILIRDVFGCTHEHTIPPGRAPRVWIGDEVRCGDFIVEGEPALGDILRIHGQAKLEDHLLKKVQAIYRSLGIEIDDKHLEIIIARMLRKVRVDSVGDTGLLPGSVIDRFDFRNTNMELMGCVKIKDPGDTDFRQGGIVPRDYFDQENARVEGAGLRKADWIKPKPASASPQLLGITKAAVSSESFLSAASFQETTKVLTEAALAGRVDYLVGLKENVLMGRLIPAGTGFKSYQEAEVRIRPEALEALAEKGPGYSRYPRDEAPALTSGNSQHGKPPATPSQSAFSDERPNGPTINIDREESEPTPTGQCERADVRTAIESEHGNRCEAATSAKYTGILNPEWDSPAFDHQASSDWPILSSNGSNTEVLNSSPPQPENDRNPIEDEDPPQRAAAKEGEDPMPQLAPSESLLYANMVRILGDIVHDLGIGRVFLRSPWTASGRDSHPDEGFLVCFYSHERMGSGPLPDSFSEFPPDLILMACPSKESWRTLRRRADDYLDEGVTVVCLLERVKRSLHAYFRDEEESITRDGELLTLTQIHNAFTLPVRALFE